MVLPGSLSSPNPSVNDGAGLSNATSTQAAFARVADTQMSQAIKVRSGRTGELF